MFKALLALALVIGSNTLVSVNFTSPMAVRPGNGVVFHRNNYFAKNKKNLPTIQEFVTFDVSLQNDGYMILPNGFYVNGRGFGGSSAYNRNINISIYCDDQYYGLGMNMSWATASKTKVFIQVQQIQLSEMPLQDITNHCVPN